MNADLHTLTGAYAVNGLSDEEQALFEQHLDQCEACRREVRELRETTALLALGAAETPSPGLRAKVLAEVSTTRQLPPAVAPPFGSGADRPRGLSGRRWFVPVLTGVAAALLALVVALGVVVAQLANRLGDEQANSEAVAAVLAAPDAKEELARSSEGGTARLVVSRSSGKAVVFFGDMPPAPEDRDYQLWLIGPGLVQSVGLTEGGEATTPVVVTLVPGAEEFGVTEEQEGGADKPTTSPLLAMELPA